MPNLITEPPGPGNNALHVSIVIAVHNDEEFVGRAIESALRQTEDKIEIICVDDASTDQTPSVVSRYLGDTRLKLIESTLNRSAYQTRRIGVEAASAPFVLFLDGDDELSPDAAEISLRKAHDVSADVVGFGVEIAMPDGQGAPKFERSLQPKHGELTGDKIVSALFPKGHPAQGHLWKYLFRRELLIEAYSGADESDRFYRANDIPVSFLALSAARKYVSTNTRLYRYYFRRGTSGQPIQSIDDFRFYLSAIDAMASIKERVPPHALPSYVSASRSMIGNLLRDCLERTSGQLRSECLSLLNERVGALEMVLAAADFCRAALPMLVEKVGRLEVPSVRRASSVVVTTAHLQTGGLRGVVSTQVQLLAREGIDVTVALHKREPSDRSLLPGARLSEVVGSSWAEKIESYIEICAEAKADAIIDHHILYDEYWPFYALAARAVGIGTIGWIHSFSLRPVFNGSSRLSFMISNMAALKTVVVLSPTDAAFWSLSGVENVVYLPNPPSPMLLSREHSFTPREIDSGPIELVWWGRLEQATKQVRELIKVAKELEKLGTEFHLSIIGPDGPDLTRRVLQREVDAIGVGDLVDVVGPLYDTALISALQNADLCLMTSAIEGYPLTLVEGQAIGLPIVMYEMPWLAYPEGNEGIRTVPQSDSKKMAQEIKLLAENPQLYRYISAAAVECAKPVFALDFGKLYRDLVENSLDSRYLPSPTANEYATLLRLSVIYSERTSRTLRRARSEISTLKNKPSSNSVSPVILPDFQADLPDIEPFQRYRKKKSSPLRKLLSTILPSSWRHANFISEREAKWNQSAFTSLVRQQSELTQAVHNLRETIKRNR